MIDRAFHGTQASDSAGVPARGVFLGLRRCGLSAQQAGNLAAHLQGIQPVPGGWTVDEIERLRFAHWLVASGRIGTDDLQADAGPSAPFPPSDRWGVQGSRPAPGSPQSGRDRQPASAR